MLKELLNNNITEEEFIRNYDITIIYTKLPKNVHGLCFPKKRNYIVINSNLGDKNKKLTLLHEFAHIELHHLDKIFFNTKIKDIEDEADRYMKFLLEE